MAGHSKREVVGTDSSLYAVAAMCAVFFGAATWALSGPRSSQGSGGAPDELALAIPAPDLDAGALERARRSVYTPARESFEDPALERLVAEFRLANDHQFTTKPVPTVKQDDLLVRLEQASTQVLERFPKEAFVALGEPIFKECASELSALQADVASGAITLRQATSDPNFETYSKYRRSCGSILGMLVQRKLVDEKAQWVDATRGPVVVDLLQRYRWAFLAHKLAPPTSLLPKSDAAALTQWRIWASDSFSPEERMVFARRARESTQEYPAELAMAMIYDELGQTELATQMLLEGARTDKKNASQYKELLTTYQNREKK